jgi:hypothetical protein
MQLGDRGQGMKLKRSKQSKASPLYLTLGTSSLSASSSSDSFLTHDHIKKFEIRQ